jgi:hypothetical protein
MAFVVDEPRIGTLPIASIDAGVVTYTSSAGVQTIIPSPPSLLGNIVRAVDPLLGEGEFICLKGVAATVVGSVVVWDGVWATTLAPTTALQGRPVAFAMAANVNPANYGWYQIGGQVTAFKDTAATIAANSAVGVSAVGAVGATAAGVEIEGARSTNTGSLGAGTTSVTLYVDRPTLQGRIT